MVKKNVIGNEGKITPEEASYLSNGIKRLRILVNL